MPTPMSTFTAILPVMCIMAPSALLSRRVTVRDASVSGSEVPSATSVIAANHTRTNLAVVVQCSHEPRQSQAQEHVDGVAAGDVAHAVVCVFASSGRGA